MNEFEWLRRTRALQRDAEPDRDLWPAIAARIEPAAGPRGYAWLPLASTAAVVLISLMLGVLAMRTPALLPAAPGLAFRPAGPWQPADPRLVGAAIEFDAAESQLRLALQQAPDASFLHHIQQRTQAQKRRLERYPLRAP